MIVPMSSPLQLLPSQSCRRKGGGGGGGIHIHTVAIASMFSLIPRLSFYEIANIPSPHSLVLDCIPIIAKVGLQYALIRMCGNNTCLISIPAACNNTNTPT